jgi:hypothetical protein
MGRGIAAVVPLTFSTTRSIFEPMNGFEERYFAPGFADNFDITENEKSTDFTIKPDVLIKNYKAFLAEFYGLIGEDFAREAEIRLDDIPDVSSLDEILQIFERYERNMRIPYVDGGPYSFDTLGCYCKSYWLFYYGSNKVIIESYETFSHMEKILAKAMENPLAHAVKFGEYG